MGKYCDISHDGMQAYTTYGDAEQGKLIWGGNELPLIVDGQQFRGVYLSFAFVDNPSSPYYNKHIAYMAEVDRPNTGLFCVCEDGYIQLLHGAAYGTNPGIVSKRADLIFQSSGFTYVYNGEPRTIPLSDGTSQGIAYLNDSYEVIWMDNVIGTNSPVYDGYQFVRAYKVGNWVFGQSAYDPMQVLAYQFSTGKLFVAYNGRTEVAPRGNDVYGYAWLALSEPGLFVPQDQFTLISEQPPVNEFKQRIIEKLPMQLNADEIDYLISLVEDDMD